MFQTLVNYKRPPIPSLALMAPPSFLPSHSIPKESSFVVDIMIITIPTAHLESRPFFVTIVSDYCHSHFDRERERHNESDNRGQEAKQDK